MEIAAKEKNKSSQYKKLKFIAKGGGGEVFLCLDLINNREVVIKSGLVGSSLSGIGMENIRELKFFTELGTSNHPNILKLYDCYFEKGKVNIVLERCKGDLMGLISNFDVVISIADIKAILHDILSPLEYLHKRFIAHRDIKPENYLVGLDHRLRLSDFGLSRYVGTPRDNYTSKVQTTFYKAPEVLMKAPIYSTSLDMWSVGCILGSLLLRAPLFLGKSDDEILYAIYTVLGTPSKKLWPEIDSLPGYVEFSKTFDTKRPQTVFPNAPEDVLDLLYRMLDYNPQTRITAEQALCHPFFTNEPSHTLFESILYWG